MRQAAPPRRPRPGLLQRRSRRPPHPEPPPRRPRPRQLRPDRTLQSLYLDPLEKAHSRTAAESTPTAPRHADDRRQKRRHRSYTALKQTLQPYRDHPHRLPRRSHRPGAITIVISGNRDRKTMAGESVRHAALDGFSSDLDPPLTPLCVSRPLGQRRLEKSFSMEGAGPISPEDSAKLKSIVTKSPRAKTPPPLLGTPGSTHHLENPLRTPAST